MTLETWLPIAQVASVVAMVTATGFASRYLHRRRRLELDCIHAALAAMRRRLETLEKVERDTERVTQSLTDNESLRWRITALEHAYDELAPMREMPEQTPAVLERFKRAPEKKS